MMNTMIGEYVVTIVLLQSTSSAHTRYRWWRLQHATQSRTTRVPYAKCVRMRCVTNVNTYMNRYHRCPCILSASISSVYVSMAFRQCGCYVKYIRICIHLSCRVGWRRKKVVVACRRFACRCSTMTMVLNNDCEWRREITRVMLVENRDCNWRKSFENNLDRCVIIVHIGWRCSCVPAVHI